MSPQPSRKTIRRRRRVLLAVTAGVLLVVLFLALRPVIWGTPDWVGRWAGSDDLLGSTVWRVARDSKQGGTYTVKGLSVAGRPVTGFHLDDGKLFATGSTAEGDWKVELRMLQGEQQLIATYWSADGGEARRIRFTRTPPG